MNQHTLVEREKYRPALHFSPAKNWINDPNGLVYYKGEYHLFYQYHAHSTIWGPMHWGHAISRNLVDWEELPIALYPDELGQIFSGSVVIDWENTSGFQSGEEAVMVAVFTHHGEDNEKQSIAYSNDCGQTWTKYVRNPVMSNPSLKDFRDPKVMWHKESSKWIMSLACGNHIRFYGSANLKDWSYLSSFGETYGAHGGVWECPDLIHLEVEGQSTKKWVLIVSINPGGPNGGSAIQYFTGDFDGITFTTDQQENDELWADWGRDFYAAVTWSGAEKPTWIGWMNNWQYANQTPTEEFRGSMSIARELLLECKEGVYSLIQKPILPDQLEKQIVFHEGEGSMIAEAPIQIEVPSAPFIVELDLKEENDVTLTISLQGKSTFLDIHFDVANQKVSLDRTKSGQVEFSKLFPSIDTMPINKLEKLFLLVDHVSVELFVNEGRSVMTSLFYPTQSINMIEVRTDGQAVYNQFTIQTLKG